MRTSGKKLPKSDNGDGLMAITAVLGSTSTTYSPVSRSARTTDWPDPAGMS